MELLKLMSDRYTCRRYSEKDVKEEDLNGSVTTNG